MVKTIPIKVSAIGLGLGGSNIAEALASRLKGNAFHINISEQDLATSSTPELENRLHLGNGTEYGAGRDRKVSKALFDGNPDDIRDFVYDHSRDREIVFICAAAGGGTGSGLIAKTIAMVFTEYFLDRFKGNTKIPMFFAVIATPDTNEGLKAHINTIDLLKELKKLAEHGIGRFILVSNQYAVNEKDSREKFSRINERTTGLIARYLEQYGTSKAGCLDRADRFAGLDVPGIHSFMTFDAERKVESPFILPEGAHIKSVLAELPEGFHLADELDRWGLNVGDKSEGFFIADDQLTPIVHLAGFQNFNKLTERFAHQVELIQNRASETKTLNITQGTGFDRLGEHKAVLKDEYKPKVAKSMNQISDLLDQDD